MTSAIPLINIEQIVAMAGETTFAKGMLLAKAGSVHQLTWQENSVSARDDVTRRHRHRAGSWLPDWRFSLAIKLAAEPAVHQRQVQKSTAQDAEHGLPPPELQHGDQQHGGDLGLALGQ